MAIRLGVCDAHLGHQSIVCMCVLKTFIFISHISELPAANHGNPVFTCDKDSMVRAQTIVNSPSKWGKL